MGIELSYDALNRRRVQQKHLTQEGIGQMNKN